MPTPEALEPPVTFHLQSLEATMDLGQAIARGLHAGDCLLLEGDLGAGKTALARAIISECLAAPEDIPSPTFTLVQTYETPDFELWHCDLYRLTSADELIELGLDDAFKEAVTLIEWPDRLGPYTPRNAQHLTLTTIGDEARQLEIRGDARWAAFAGALTE